MLWDSRYEWLENNFRYCYCFNPILTLFFWLYLNGWERWGVLFSMIINQPIWLRLGQNFSWLLYYFAYVNAFPWWHHRFLFKILAIIVLSISTELIIVSEFITTRLKAIELCYALLKKYGVITIPFLLDSFSPQIFSFSKICYIFPEIDEKLLTSEQI